MQSPAIQSTKWVAAFLLLGTLALGLLFRWQGGPTIGNDSYQYLDAASHLAQGKCLCVEIAHFDEQTAPGRMPVPFTHFAPGYPILIAGISKLGFAMELSGYLVSALGFLLTIWLIWDLALTLGARPVATAMMCLLWVIHTSAQFFASNVGTESIFTAVVLGVGALMARDMKAEGRNPAWLLVLGLAASVAYSIRYAGLFVIPVVGLYLLWRAWKNPAARVYAGLALLVEVGLMAAIQIHNVLGSGSWKGGFSAGASHSLRQVAVETVKAVFHVIFGDRVIATTIWPLLFILALGVALSFLRKARFPRPYVSGAFLWIGGLITAYVAGIVIVMLTSIASDMARYILPMYPLVLALMAVLFSLPGVRTQLLAVAVLTASVLIVQGQSLAVLPPTPPHTTAIVDLQQKYQGRPLSAWLLSRLGPTEPVVSVNGQAVHYVLQRPVVSIIEPEYSTSQLDDVGMHALMKKFGARFLLVFPGEKTFSTSSQDTIPFLRELTLGQSPAWLRPAASTRNTSVFECVDCGRIP